MGQKEYEEQLRELAQWISESQHIVFFGGAGVSTESGIPDFRSSDGLYAEKRRYPPEQIVSHSFFLSHTEQFYEFYKERMLYPEAAPNAAHLALRDHTAADDDDKTPGQINIHRIQHDDSPKEKYESYSRSLLYRK